MGSIIWFKNDLRIENNRLLDKLKTLDSKKAIIIEEPVPHANIDDFISYNNLKAEYRLSSIAQFNQQLITLGIETEILKGKPEIILPAYCKENNIKRIFTSRIFDQEEEKKKKNLEQILAKDNIFIDYIYNNMWIPIDELPFPIKRVPEKFKDFMREIKGLEEHYTVTDNTDLLEDENEVITALLENIEDNNAYELKKYNHSPNNNFFKFLPELTLGKISSPALLNWVKQKYKNHPGQSKIIKTFRHQLFMYDHLKLKYFADPSLDFLEPAISREPDVIAFQKWVNGETKYPLINAIMKKMSTASKISLTSKKLVIDYYNHVLGLPPFWGYWYFKKQLMEYSSELNAYLWKESLSTKKDKKQMKMKVMELGLKLDPKQKFTNHWGGNIAS